MNYQIDGSNVLQLFAEEDSPAPIPSYKLFDSDAVTVASVLGGPVPGTMLMACNYRRLGQNDNAAAMLFAGLAGTAAIAWLVSLLPSGTSAVVGVLLVVAMRNIANSLQGPAVDNHVNRGGGLGSKWAAAGVGTVFLALVCAAIFTPAINKGFHGPKVTIGSGEVYYSGSASSEEATALGEQLKTLGYFGDQEVTVSLSKDPDGTILSFVVKDGIWDQPNMISSFEEIGREVAPTIGGFPIKVRFVNSTQETQKELMVGKLSVGNGAVYYLGAANELDAKAVGDALQAGGFPVSKSFDAFVSKGKTDTTISFVIVRGWDDPAVLAYFDKIVRQAAPSIGGLPVKLCLINSALQVVKEEVIG